MKIYPKHSRLEKVKGKEKLVKVICTHCGNKQTVREEDYFLNNVACKICKKKGELKHLI